jgi:hypothetical protein
VCARARVCGCVVLITESLTHTHTHTHTPRVIQVSIPLNVFEAARAVYAPIADRVAHFEGEGLALAAETTARRRRELLECQLDLRKLLEMHTKGWKFEVLVAGLLASQIREKAVVPDAVAAYFAHGASLHRCGVEASFCCCVPAYPRIPPRTLSVARVAAIIFCPSHSTAPPPPPPPSPSSSMVQAW